MGNDSGGAERYFPKYDEFEEEGLVAQGIEGRVPYKGPVASIVHQMIGGLRAGMGYAGCASIEEMHARVRFVRITDAGSLPVTLFSPPFPSFRFSSVRPASFRRAIPSSPEDFS